MVVTPLMTNQMWMDVPGKADEQTEVAPHNDASFDEGSKLLEAATGNRIADPMLNAALNLETPDFQPKAGSPALNTPIGPAADAEGFFDTHATFIGAKGTEDWTAGWTAFPKE